MQNLNRKKKQEVNIRYIIMYMYIYLKLIFFAIVLIIFWWWRRRISLPNYFPFRIVFVLHLMLIIFNTKLNWISIVLLLLLFINLNKCFLYILNGYLLLYFIVVINTFHDSSFEKELSRMSFKNDFRERVSRMTFENE